MPPRPLPQSLKDKIAKLFPRLGSPFDGEIVATATAIQKALTAADRDWHDLTAALVSEQAASQQITGTSSHREIGGEQLLVLCESILARAYWLNPRAKEFLHDMQVRALGHDRVFLTEKQLSWLMNLSQRAGVV